MSLTESSKKDLESEWEGCRLTDGAPEEPDPGEEVLRHLTGGHMGTYQWWLFFMMMPVGVLYSLLYGVQIFAAATPERHWCKVPQLMHLDLEARRNLSIPGAPGWEERCAEFDVDWEQPGSTPGPPVPCRHGWEFLHDDIPYPTVVSERSWVCDKASYAPTAQALFFVGSLAGGALFGWMGDALGRVPALVAANAAGAVGGALSTVSSGIWDYAACSFLAGMANDACYGMMYIILLEYVGAAQRSRAANMSLALFFGGGGALLPMLALWTSDWRRLMLFTSLPMLLALFAPLVVPESARWLASKGRVEEAVKVLEKFERINKNKIPPDVLKKFITAAGEEGSGDSPQAALRGALGRRLAALLVVTIAVSLAIDAVIRLSASIGDLFLTYALSSLAEIPALTLVALLLDRWGRRALTAGSLMAGGVAALACAAASGYSRLALALGARMAINVALAAVTQLAAELLPTPLRARGLSLLHMATFAATALSPYIVYSGVVWRGLPLVLVAAVAGVGAGTALLLPETRGCRLPHSVLEAEAIARDTVLWARKSRTPTDEPVPHVGDKQLL